MVLPGLQETHESGAGCENGQQQKGALLLSETSSRKLSFTIQGEFVNRLALERCYVDGDIPAAIELLKSCLVTDELSDGERLALAVDILDGKALMKGVYPGDYHIEQATPKKPERTVANKIKDMVQQLKDQRAEIRRYQQQITAIAEYISEDWDGERKLGLINAY